MISLTELTQHKEYQGVTFSYIHGSSNNTTVHYFLIINPTMISLRDLQTSQNKQSRRKIVTYIKRGLLLLLTFVMASLNLNEDNSEGHK